MQKRMGIIGLGVIGRRMLDMLNGHDRLTVARAWDPNSEASAGARAAFPGLEVVDATPWTARLRVPASMGEEWEPAEAGETEPEPAPES